jgi:hypothetical protein
MWKKYRKYDISIQKKPQVSKVTMPNWSEYWSDASITSSDSEEEDEEEEIYCPRELDYWALEDFLETRRPPPVIEYLVHIGVVNLRECVIGDIRSDIDSVLKIPDKYGWISFWQGKTTDSVSSPRYFSYEDWDAIGEYCFSLCECCRMDTNLERIKSTMINVLKYGKFKSLKY